MIVKPIAVEIDKATGEVCIVAHFWYGRVRFEAGALPDIVEDFVMQLRPSGQCIVTDARGWLKRADGVFVDPATLVPGEPEPKWVTEVAARDVLAEAEANIAWFASEAVKLNLKGDRTSRARGGTDTRGLVPKLSSLKDAAVEL